MSLKHIGIFCAAVAGIVQQHKLHRQLAHAMWHHNAACVPWCLLREAMSLGGVQLHISFSVEQYVCYQQPCLIPFLTHHSLGRFKGYHPSVAAEVYLLAKAVGGIGIEGCRTKDVLIGEMGRNHASLLVDGKSHETPIRCEP